MTVPVDLDPNDLGPEWFDPDNPGRYAPLVPTVDHGPVQVWLRHVNQYENVIGASPYTKFMYTTADLARKHFKADTVFRRCLPPNTDYEWLLVDRKVVLHHESRRYGEDNYEPRRIPTWGVNEDPEVLLRLCESGRHERIAVGWLKRGQENRLFNQRSLDFIYRTALAYPSVKFHYALGGAFRHQFGLNFASVDFDPVFSAKRKRILLPNGISLTEGSWIHALKWIHVLGYSITDLKRFEHRVRFNIASALWAAEHFKEAEPLTATTARRRDADPLGVLSQRRTPSRDRDRARSTRPSLGQKFYHPYLDPDAYPQTSPDVEEPYAVTQEVMFGPTIPVRHPTEQTNDRTKILCNSCSLAHKCKVFREGAICAVSSSPTSRLADSFGTRDTEVIKGVLAEILGRQVERYERSAKKFRDDDESDVTDLRRAEHLLKMETSLVRSTETFMKILDPQYRESNVPSIVGTQMNVYNPRVLVADVVKQLEESGIDRTSLTPELIQQAIEQRQPESSQATVIDG